MFDLDTGHTWVSAPDGRWNGTGSIPSEHDKSVILGWATAIFGGGVVVPGFPLAVWSSSPTSQLNKTGLGLGYNSSVLQSFVTTGVFQTAPKQLGVFLGSRGEFNPTDGELVIGGWDESRIKGPIVWFPIGKRYASYDCPLQVLVNDIILTNGNGAQSLFVDPDSKTPFCIDPIQNPFTFSDALYRRWANLTSHPSSGPTDGSPPYTDRTYPWASESLIGELDIKITNDQGQTYTIKMPHDEIRSHERNSDSQGRYSVINETRAMADISSPSTGIGGFPLLGGAFLGQNYLIVDYERGVFGLAPAVIGQRSPSEANSLRRVVSYCSVKASSSHKPDAKVIALSVVLSVFGLILLILAVLKLFRWRQKRNILKKPERDSAGEVINLAITAQQRPTPRNTEEW